MQWVQGLKLFVNNTEIFCNGVARKFSPVSKFRESSPFPSLLFSRFSSLVVLTSLVFFYSSCFFPFLLRFLFFFALEILATGSMGVS